jgi:hypothetical protein
MILFINVFTHSDFLLGRPCQRCIKRSIGHLCHDEPKPSAVAAAARNTTVKDKENNRNSQNIGQNNMNMMPKAILDGNWMGFKLLPGAGGS